MISLSVAFALLIAAAAAYLLGSVNFAIIVGKLTDKQDIRNYGSGNAGMTNVLRTFGKLPAVLTTLGDFLKGVLAVWGGRLLVTWIAGEFPLYGYFFLLLPGLLGHCFPVFYNFRGGKGVLICAGMICVSDWRVLLVILFVFLAAVSLSRYVSLGSILAAAAYPVSTFVFALLDGDPFSDGFLKVLLALLVGGIVIFMHRGNIQRLLEGSERKLSFSKK